LRSGECEHIQPADPTRETLKGQYLLQHPVTLCTQQFLGSMAGKLGASKATQRYNLQTVIMTKMSIDVK